jgi:hypothetical protein
VTEPFSYRTIVRRIDSDTLVRAKVSFEGTPPHFAVTGHIFGRGRLRGEERIRYEGHIWYVWGFGMCHAEIRKGFPELEPFLRWHLATAEGPWGYVGNAVFHHDLWTAFIAGPPWDGSERDEFDRKYGGSYECGKWVSYPRGDDSLERSRAHFYTTIAHGAAPSDAGVSEDDIIRMDRAELTAWLEGRLSEIRQAFVDDMAKVKALAAEIGEKIQ